MAIHSRPATQLPLRLRGVPARAALALAWMVLAGTAALATSLPASGRMAREPVNTRVDSETARRLLELGASYRQAAGLTAKARAALDEADRQPMSTALLRRLTQDLSVDTAAIYFANRLTEGPENASLRTRYEGALASLRAGGLRSASAAALAPGAIVAFVPGFGWRSDRTTGADFARQRALLERLGIPTRLIETSEDGAIERNAEIVATALTRLAAAHDRVFLVSASKGGPEAALALRRTPRPVLSHVSAWVSVGGLLRGSPYADRFTAGLRGLLARTVFAFKGLSGGAIADLSTKARGATMTGFSLPASVRAVAWIGAPLSGHVRDDVRGRWQAMRAEGPNDGLTLLADELIPGGRAFISPGLDHYFRDPEIDAKTAALTLVVFEEASASPRPSPVGSRPR